MITKLFLFQREWLGPLGGGNTTFWVNLEKKQLVDYFKSAEKPRSNWKIGLEQELFGFNRERKRISYDEELKFVLQDFVDRYAWIPYYEEENLIGLKKNGSSITIEPGGQLELSLKPLATIGQIEAELTEYRNQLREVSKEFEISWISMGADPISEVQKIGRVPKKRYQIMGEYLPQFGIGAETMMKATCTAQSNFDYADEEDMRQKMLVTTAFSSVVSLLFATSPIREQRTTEFRSVRNWAWRNLDLKRSGLIPAVFNQDFSYLDYVEYALDAPMFLLQREDGILDCRGQDFREFLQNADEKQWIESDWPMQLGVVFPVSRLRNAIETRSCDAGPFSFLLAQSAFWKGLLYDQTSLDEAVGLVRKMGYPLFLELHQNLYRDGFDYRISTGEDLKELVEKVYQLSFEGNQRLDRATGCEDAKYLAPMASIVSAGKSVSDLLRNKLTISADYDLFSLLQENDLFFA